MLRNLNLIHVSLDNDSGISTYTFGKGCPFLFTGQISYDSACQIENGISYVGERLNSWQRGYRLTMLLYFTKLD